MKQPVLIGQTDYTVLVKMRTDAGAPATGLDESDIDIAYARVETDNDVTTTDVTPAALAALTDAHTDWGFEEVSATDHPGLYRLDIADAVFASGAWSAVVTITGTGLDPADLEFVLVNFDPKATTLPANSINAAAIATGAIDADAIADNAIDAGAIASDAITAAKIASDAITAAKIATGAITAAKFAAGAIDAAAIANGAIDAATFAADVDAEILSYLVDDATRIDASQLNTHTAITVAAIADQVWEEALADHEGTAGSTAEALADAGGSGASAADIADAVWDEATAGHTTSGTFGEQLKTDVDAILTDTNELQTDWTNGGRLDLLLDATLADTNELQVDWTNGGRLDLLLDATLADTNELQADWTDGGRLDLIVDAILVDTAEIGAAGAGLTNINLPNQTMDIVGNITGNLSGSVGSVTGAVGSVTGNVGGSVGSVTGAINTAAGVITTLDGLDTAQDTQHSTTQGLVTTVDGVADSILVDTTQIKADLPGRITKNTALAAFPFFMADATDGYTAETGLTITATRSLDGAAFAACANSATEIGSGWYKIDLAAGDLNANTVILRFTGTGARDRFITIVTQVT